MRQRNCIKRWCFAESFIILTILIITTKTISIVDALSVSSSSKKGIITAQGPIHKLSRNTRKSSPNSRLHEAIINNYSTYISSSSSNSNEEDTTNTVKNSDTSPSSSNTLSSTSSTTSSTGTRWSDSSRWENTQDTNSNNLLNNIGGGIGTNDQQRYILKEKYGTYFKVPNPASLMTKIICTMGPATADPTMIGKLIDAGMSAARINMSHTSHEAAGIIIDKVRAVAKSRSKFCPIVLDTKGPEIRIAWISDNTKLLLQDGDELDLYTGKYSQGNEVIKPQVRNKRMAAVVTYDYLCRAVKVGDVILLNDGRISLLVTKVDDMQDVVHTQVIQGGELVVNKGVNLPGCQVELPHITDKDIDDILFGVSKKVEYVAHSFTRSATGINQVRELPGVVETGCHIIAKIESQEGLDNFGNILAVSDGVMVARGDLGVEIPLERVCSVQKRLVSACNSIGKPVIVATELLDSMIQSPRPTRAEASDVANAVFDGADCLMLSGESAVGKYPLESVQVMTRICKEAELDVASSLRGMAVDGNNNNNGSGNLSLQHRWVSSPSLSTSYDAGTLRDAFAKSAVNAARETGADLIMAISRTGLTVNALAKYFSSVPVMVLTANPQVCAQVLLHRSVTPYLVKSLERESCIPRAVAKATELGLVRPGSRVLLLTGKDNMIANRLETFIVGESGQA